MPRPLVRVKHWPSHPTHHWVVVYRQGARRRCKYFTGEKAAKNFANQKYVELVNEGRKHGEITIVQIKPAPREDTKFNPRYIPMLEANGEEGANRPALLIREWLATTASRI